MQRKALIYNLKQFILHSRLRGPILYTFLIFSIGFILAFFKGEVLPYTKTWLQFNGFIAFPFVFMADALVRENVFPSLVNLIELIKNNKDKANILTRLSKTYYSPGKNWFLRILIVIVVSLPCIYIGFPLKGVLHHYFNFLAVFISFIGSIPVVRMHYILSITNKLKDHEYSLYKVVPHKTPELVHFVNITAWCGIFFLFGFFMCHIATHLLDWQKQNLVTALIQTVWFFLYFPVGGFFIIFPQYVANKILRKEKYTLLKKLQSETKPTSSNLYNKTNFSLLKSLAGRAEIIMKMKEYVYDTKIIIKYSVNICSLIFAYLFPYLPAFKTILPKITNFLQ